MSAPSHPLQRIASGGAEALFRLFQLYYYVGSDWADEDIGPDGLFDASPEPLADYINDPAKGAYWIRKVGALAGFVVTEPFTLPNGSVAEEVADLFILKRYRRQGLAFEAVHALARTFTGPMAGSDFSRRRPRRRVLVASVRQPAAKQRALVRRSEPAGPNSARNQRCRSPSPARAVVVLLPASLAPELATLVASAPRLH